MNSLSYYDRSGASWSVDESNEVRTEYETDLLTIIDIGNKHKRTPGGIAYKLKKLGIVHNALSRGYTEYKTSSLYDEICTQYKKDDAEKKIKKEEKLKLKEESVKTMTKSDNINEIKSLKDSVSEIKKEGKLKLKEESVKTMTKSDIVNEIKSLKDSVSEIKKDIKQMLSYITSIYEFEKEGYVSG